MEEETTEEFDRENSIRQTTTLVTLLMSMATMYGGDVFAACEVISMLNHTTLDEHRVTDLDEETKQILATQQQQLLEVARAVFDENEARAAALALSNTWGNNAASA